MPNSIYKINFKIAKYHSTLENEENYPSNMSRKTGFALWNRKHVQKAQRVTHLNYQGLTVELMRLRG